ncbi:MAG: hypothetical protein HUJ76_02495 [Parasporobacterium sp.]|nr:hypothetical protein [Parasporobacterium sp.]
MRIKRLIETTVIFVLVSAMMVPSFAGMDQYHKGEEAAELQEEFTEQYSSYVSVLIACAMGETDKAEVTAWMKSHNVNCFIPDSLLQMIISKQDEMTEKSENLTEDAENDDAVDVDMLPAAERPEAGEFPTTYSEQPTASSTQPDTEPPVQPIQPVTQPQTQHVHSWVSPTCTAAGYCSSCGAKGSEATGHDWAAAACTSAGYCTRCGASGDPAYGHNFGSNSPTCYYCGAANPDYVEEHVHTLVDVGYGWKTYYLPPKYICNTCGSMYDTPEEFGGYDEHGSYHVDFYIIDYEECLGEYYPGMACDWVQYAGQRCTTCGWQDF